MSTEATMVLAKTMATMSLQALGYTKTMIERAWADDAEARQVFLDGAQIHTDAIKAEALNEAAEELPHLDRPANMLVRQQDAAAWLRERANETAANIHVGSRVRGGDQGA